MTCLYIQYLEILGLVDNMTTMSLATRVIDEMEFLMITRYGLNSHIPKKHPYEKWLDDYKSGRNKITPQFLLLGHPPDPCPQLHLLPSIPAVCLLYTSPSPRDGLLSRMPSSAWKKKVCRLLLEKKKFIFFFFFFNDPATTEIYTLHIVGSVRCV